MTNPGSLRRRGSRAAAELLCVSVVGGGLAACGGGGDAQQRFQQAESDRARADAAAQQARNSERARQAQRETARLRKEVDQLKSRQDAAAASGAGGAGDAAATVTGSRSCADGLSANSATSCPFAENVRSAYFSSGQASTIAVYSPVTGQTYTMRCSSGSPHVCEGANDAAVYFP